MITVKPYYFDNFYCYADKCTDTCCAGWEIDVDSVSYEKYMALGGELGDKLRSNIVSADGCKCFKTGKDGKCPFLEKSGLCEIYASLGPDGLCDICAEHPRFYGWYCGRTEVGLALCCEAVCDLTFSTLEPLTFVTECEEDNLIDKTDSCSDSEDFFGECISDDVNLLVSLRDELFSIIYNRRKSIAERIAEAVKKANNANKDFFGSCFNINNHSKAEIIKEIVKTMLKTEPVNDIWLKNINGINSCLPEIIKEEKKLCYRLDETNFDEALNCGADFLLNPIRYEQLFTYLIYRYFLEKNLYEDMESAAKFCLFNICYIYISEIYIKLSEEKITETDILNNIKLWSKQVEYSEENINAITEEALKIF